MSGGAIGEDEDSIKDGSGMGNVKETKKKEIRDQR